ncbi:MAG TPA: biotin--[acetyl-CoA-carboxylase] ligase [Methylomirabilota bacterium]|nr:biotin--[acetyl-CoA-carboxylase] ligase [Methylomirabilota bacterium]
MAAALIGCAVHALGEVDSTQSHLAALAAQGAPEGTVVTARHQTRGRGRRGRAWWDRSGESVLLSVLLRPSLPAGRAVVISLVAGVAVAEALGVAAGVAARLRWPNDVLVADRKVAGILAEAQSETDGHLGHVLLGIGINVNQERFPDEVGDRATSLRLATGRAHDPGRLLDAVLDALDRRYREFLTHGFGPAREAWRRLSASLGQRVTAADGRQGTAVELDEDGALVLRGDDGALHRVLAGELGEGHHAARH